jgi:hypothetical protein
MSKVRNEQFLTVSQGSVLFSRSNLLKRKDLCFSCLRLGLIRYRRSLRSSYLSSQVCHDSHRVTLEHTLYVGRRLRTTRLSSVKFLSSMLRNVSTLAPGVEAGVRLLQGGRRPSTVKSYDQNWLTIEAFTSQVQDDSRAPRMSVLAVSSQTVLTYLGYLLELGTISVKSLQTYLSLINAVHNDFEYLSPECVYLVKLVRKGFAELQGSSMLQTQEVTVFSADHMFTTVMFGRRPNASKHHIRACVCLSAQFVFFSRADSGVLCCHQCSSLRLYVLHQSDSQECRTQSSSTLFESVLSSRRSRRGS